VPTRLRKLIANSWDGIVLARAGLERLGFDCARGEFSFEGEQLGASVLPSGKFLSAGGQGIVALQLRADDAATRGVIEPLNHHDTMLCLRGEREFLRLLQGDCGTPVGVLATIESGVMTMHAQFFPEGVAEPRTATTRRELSQFEPEAIGAELLELING
jgi:porphobilinogen deaminase